MNLATALLIMVPTNIGTLLLGFFWGRKVRAVVEIGDRIEGDAMAQTQRDRVPKWMHVLAGLVTLIGITTVVLGVLVVNSESRQDRLVACVAHYSDAAAESARARSTAVGAVFAQIDAVFAEVESVFDATPTDARTRIRAVIKAYNESRQKARQAQKDHPLPEAPQNACAELLD